jgi:translation initiation factor 4A
LTNYSADCDESIARDIPDGLTDYNAGWDEGIESFDDMALPDELFRGIYACGFEKPSAIQQRAIKPTMLGNDLNAQAQSGTVRREQLNLWVFFV